MEPPKAGYRLPTKSSEAFRIRRGEDGNSSRGIPRPAARTSQTPNEADPSKSAKQTTFFPRPSTRVSSATSIRQSSTTPKLLKLTSDQQSKSVDSTTNSPHFLRSYAQAESSSPSSSSRPIGGGSSRPVQRQDVHRNKRAAIYDVGSSRNNCLGLRSPSPKSASQESLDYVLSNHPDKDFSASPRRGGDLAESPKQAAPVAVIYPELDRYRDREQLPYPKIPYPLTTQDLPPVTPGSIFYSTGSTSQLSASSASPSIRLFDTPGPSAYSRDTTPSSASSQSPGLLASGRGLPFGKYRLHSPSLSRPPVTRRRTGSISNEVDLISVDPHGLAAVKEALSSSSSSSNSSVREIARESRKPQKPEMVLESSQVDSSRPLSKPPQDHVDDGQQLYPQSKQPISGLANQDISTPPPGPSPRAQPPQASSPRPSRLIRPTRDGTLDLHSHLRGPIPVIQSNLLPRQSSNKRSGSEPAVVHSTTSGPSIARSKGNLKPALPVVKDAVVKKSPVVSKEPALTDSPLRDGASGSVARPSSGTRFTLFGLRKKPAEGTQSDKSSGSLLSKSLLASPDREGHGQTRLLKRRSGSVMSGTSRAPSGKQTPIEKAQVGVSDAFLAERLNPVIIAGGTVIENQNTSSEMTKTENHHHLSIRRPPVSLRGPDQVPASARTSSETTDSATSRSTLALRRSIRRLKSSSDTSSQVPRPISISGANLSPMTSLDASIFSDQQSMFEMRAQPWNESTPLNSSAKKLPKVRSTRKWNFFGRQKTKPVPEPTQNEQVAVTVMPLEKKPIAFYAIMDSSEQEAEPMDVQTALRQADVYAQSGPSHHARGSSGEALDFKVPEMVSPPPARVSRSSIDSQTTRKAVLADLPTTAAPTPTTSSNAPRPSRLAQVGRIPQVISRHPRTEAVPRSFSRPFGSLSQPLNHEVEVDEAVSEAPSSIFNREATLLPTSTPPANVDRPTFTNVFNEEPIQYRSPEALFLREFLTFSSPRRKSNRTASSSSSDSVKPSYVDATAKIPKPGDPPAEDEIWDEYNDLLSDDNANGSRSMPLPINMSSQEALSRGASSLFHGLAPLSGPDADMAERLTAAFQQKTTSSGPRSHDTKRTDSLKRLSTSSQKARQSGSSTSSEEWSPLAQVNLRVGSMTVSKWLTFSHVLFSDIRHELVEDVDPLLQPSILVIDGLDNDDWSLYAAETYPGANFFNLSPRAPQPLDPQNTGSGFLLKPRNHHQIQYHSHLDKFPFASHSFNCVVYRFPAAAPESHYQNILNEARRVLKPEGFIEMSILDVDLNNMGHRGRRAVRQLKEQIHGQSAQTNLASTANLMVRLLGKGGFSSIRAARVGIPVASSITHSSGEGSSSNDDATRRKKKKVGEQPTLAEMMKEHGPAADDDITNMVARVGRWWYARCYENAAKSSAAARRSIWNDKALLRECEELGTSLKLMVCCARSPKRTKSM